MTVGFVLGGVGMDGDVTVDGASATTTLGWTPVAGQLLVVVMKGQYSTTLPTWGLAGFTALPRQSVVLGSNLSATQVWYKISDGTETVLTSTQSAEGNASTHFQPHVFGFFGVPTPVNIQHEQEIVPGTPAVNIVPTNSTAAGSGMALFMRARVNARGTGNSMVGGAAGFTQRSIGTWGSQYPSSMLASKSLASAGVVVWPESTNNFVDEWLLEKVIIYDLPLPVETFGGGIYRDGAIHMGGAASSTLTVIQDTSLSTSPPGWTQVQSIDWEVPAGVTALNVTLEGGGGHEATGGANSAGATSSGGRTTCRMAVTPGDILTLRFAGAGVCSPTSAGGYGGSAAQILPSGVPAVVAGGGGGNGGTNVGLAPVGVGGDGGGTTGAAGTRGNGPNGGGGGGGGTPSAGGAGGTGWSGTDGSPGGFVGGSNGGQGGGGSGVRNGGGGGGGYWGGGGGERGGGTSDGGGGGGGGSSWADPAICTGIVHLQGVNPGPARISISW